MGLLAMGGCEVSENLSFNNYPKSNVFNQKLSLIELVVSYTYMLVYVPCIQFSVPLSPECYMAVGIEILRRSILPARVALSLFSVHIILRVDPNAKHEEFFIDCTSYFHPQIIGVAKGI